MKKNYCVNRLLFTFMILTAMWQPTIAQVISYVDTSLDGSQKYVLRVDGKPFYMTNIQVRLDLMRHSEKWPAETREAIIAQAASDGFNTVSIPIHWYEVEPVKDKFDWSILDEYLGYMNKYNIKMEMLWFGTNSGGHTQWLSRSKTDPVHLRIPDYVLYAPRYGAPSWDSREEAGFTETTSEFTIRRDMSNYTLDLADTRLRDRETYVLSKVMAHIAQWDKANGSKHPVIGVQIGNEVRGMHLPYDNALLNDYLSHVASAVKNSDYVVWTRVNCVFMDVYGRIFENERLRNTPAGTNLDFIGIDTYSHHFPTAEEFVASMRTNLPYAGKNFRMIMETNSNRPYSAQMHLAALAGNNAFDYYEISGLYHRDGNSVKAHASNIEDIRLVNKVLNSASADIALNAHGYNLFVHNWQGNKSDVTTSNAGITFDPYFPTSQGISILRSKNEIVLMTTKGGVFTIPESMKVTGHKTIRLNAGETVTLTCEDSGRLDAKTYQAEFADLLVATETSYHIEGIGFAGNGYVKFPSTSGSYICFNNIDGQGGGEKNIRIRYSHGGKKTAGFILFINGEMSLIDLPPTGGYDNYQFVTVKANLKAGNQNVIKLETNDNVSRINRAAYYEADTFVDEIQVTEVKKPITLFTIGDSTMADKPLDKQNQERGWGRKSQRSFLCGPIIHTLIYMVQK